MEFGILEPSGTEPDEDPTKGMARDGDRKSVV